MIWKCCSLLIALCFMTSKFITIHSFSSSLSQEDQILLDANYKGTDQPAHSRSLISVFVLI